MNYKDFISAIENKLVVIPILVVLVIKIPHISVPFFWDEAWSYFTAVHQMHETGPSLLPGALPLSISKGHPLFFFFLNSFWLKLFGSSVVSAHTLSLIISISTLLAIYFLVKRHVNLSAALLSISMLSVQSLYLAQATMVLPEMLITLFLILSFDFYLRKKYLLFAIWASMMVLTKETTIIFVLGFFIYHLFSSLAPGKSSRKYIFEVIFILIPIILYGGFLILHKIEFGSFFYDAHVSHIQLTKYDVVKKLRISWEMVYNRYGRFIILYSLIPAITIVLLKHKKLQKLNILLLIILQTILFLAFSIFNFYTYRYMLCILALFLIFASIIIQQASLKYKIINWLVVCTLLAVPAYYSYSVRTNTDVDLGYVDAVKIHQQMVDYCEKRDWHEESISASFNLIYYLTNPALGYLTSDKKFENVSDLVNIRDSEIFLFDGTNHGKETQIDTIKIVNQMVLDLHKRNAWGKIYTNLPID